MDFVFSNRRVTLAIKHKVPKIPILVIIQCRFLLYTNIEIPLKLSTCMDDTLKTAIS